MKTNSFTYAFNHKVDKNLQKKVHKIENNVLFFSNFSKRHGFI